MGASGREWEAMAGALEPRSHVISRLRRLREDEPGKGSEWFSELFWSYSVFWRSLPVENRIRDFTHVGLRRNF